MPGPISLWIMRGKMGRNGHSILMACQYLYLGIKKNGHTYSSDRGYLWKSGYGRRYQVLVPHCEVVS
jgi:hypothetical protein